MENKKSNKGLVIGGLVLVALIAILAVVFLVWKPGTQKGSKHITIEVTNKAQEVKAYDLYTDAEYLKDAMDEADGLTYKEEGGFVDTINEEKADWNVDSSYWAIYVNGEYGMFGIYEQPVTDADKFSFVYTVGF